MYVKKEALLSSQIEGTQASLQDVLAIDESRLNEDTQEVANYINAMNYGLGRLAEFPLSLRLLREIHARKGVEANALQANSDAPKIG